jgi:hypothetical protein
VCPTPPPPNIVRRRKDMSYIPRVSPALGRRLIMSIKPKDPPLIPNTISYIPKLVDKKVSDQWEPLNEQYLCKSCDYLSDIVVAKGNLRTCIYCQDTHSV